jgi:hypothetical protein
VTITLDVYTHLFDDARHACGIQALMTSSPFAALIDDTPPVGSAAVLELR